MSRCQSVRLSGSGSSVVIKSPSHKCQSHLSPQRSIQSVSQIGLVQVKFQSRGWVLKARSKSKSAADFHLYWTCTPPGHLGVLIRSQLTFLNLETLFDMLTPGRKLRFIPTRTFHFKNSFFPSAVRLMKSYPIMSSVSVTCPCH